MSLLQDKCKREDFKWPFKSQVDAFKHKRLCFSILMTLHTKLTYIARIFWSTKQRMIITNMNWHSLMPLNFVDLECIFGSNLTDFNQDWKQRIIRNVIRSSLMPWNTKDFAPSIWHKMYVNSLRTVQSAYSRLFDDNDSKFWWYDWVILYCVIMVKW